MAVLSRSQRRPLLDLLLLAEKIVDFGLQLLHPFLFALCRRLSVLDKAVDQLFLQLRDPRPFPLGSEALFAGPPSFSSPMGAFCIVVGNHGFLSSPLVIDAVFLAGEWGRGQPAPVDRNYRQAATPLG